MLDTVLSAGLLFGVIIYIFYSTKNQKENANTQSNSSILVLTFFSTIIALFSMYILFFLDITSIKTNYFNKDHYLNLFISSFNSICYLAIPTLFLYINESNSSEFILILGDDNQTFFYSFTKYFFYYLTIILSLNLMYSALYQIFSLNVYSNIIELTKVPYILRKFSVFNSTYELLNYSNFLVLLILGKILVLYYIPYSSARIVSYLIDSLKTTKEIKKEYHDLNNNIHKNSEAIRQITTQKLLTGKPLTREERIILKSCKENESILNHKQEILDDKYSSVKVFLSYFVIPFKFLGIIIFILMNILIIALYSNNIYNKFYNSLCGKNCSFLTDRKNIFSFSLDNYFYNLLTNNLSSVAIISISVLLIFRFCGVLIGLNEKGILGRISYEDIKNNSSLKLISYLFIFLMGASLLFDVANILPDMSFYFNLPENCNIMKISDHDCGISKLGKILIKLNLNFKFYAYFEIIYNFLFISASLYYLGYLSIQSVKKLFNEDGNTNNDIEN